MISIAINEPVILAKAAKDTEGRLTLTFEQIVETAADEEANNPFAALDKEDDYSEFGSSANTQNIKIFGFKNVNHKNEKLEPNEITKDISNVKDQLFHILSGYTTSDKIKLGGSVLWADTGIDANNYNELIKDQTILNKVYDNLICAFMEQFNDLPNKEDHFRLLLLRQSKDKSFPTLRKNFIKDNPFWEPITVPKEQSKVKFTAYEIKQGLNKADTPDISADVPATATPAASDVFGV